MKIIRSATAIAALAGAAMAAEMSAMPTLKLTVGEDAINSIMAYAFRDGYAYAEGGSSLHIKMKSIYLDIEAPSATFHADLVADWSVPGSSGSKHIVLDKTVSTSDLTFNVDVDLIRLKGTLFSAYTDLPDWVTGTLEKAVNRIYPLEGYLARASVSLNALDRQIVDYAPIYSTTEYSLGVQFAKDQVTLYFGNKVRFAEPSMFLSNYPNPVKNMNFKLGGFSNMKFRIRKATIYDQAGNYVFNTSTDDWAVQTQSDHTLWSQFITYPGSPRLANSLDDPLKMVGENSNGAWRIVRTEMMVSQ
jgi:hypothetical protein